jgi:uncharacterized repeat protein (TIGR03803 family)
MIKLNSWMKACTLFLLWAATAIALPAQTFTTVHSFAGADGSEPQATLIQATDGNFYGTTTYGGSSSACDGGCGTVFKITPGGTLTTLHSFTGPDGIDPYAGVVQGSDGNFYGTTYYGGASTACSGGCGTVFKMTPSGTVTTLHSFDYKDGAYPPVAALLQVADGSFYGTTLNGGTGGCTNACGTIYRITPTGPFTLIHRFLGYPDGSAPYSGLIQATDGNFYGTTSFGGVYNWGAVFKLTPKGTLTNLYSFCALGDGCPDGSTPSAAVIQATNGNLYGTTSSGSNGTCFHGCGTIFQITLGGTLTTLHSFDSTDGHSPLLQLVQGTNGVLYGTTNTGGTNGPCNLQCGTVYSITTSGTFATIHDFCSDSGCTDGATPVGGLMQSTNGKSYATTPLGGANGEGTVYSVSFGLGPFVTTPPASGTVGAAVKILGTNLTGATGVTFNGTPATFTVVSSSEITTTVPAGAKTGKVKVTLPHGTLISNANFRVTP